MFLIVVAAGRGDWLLLLVVGYWLLVVGCLLVVVGCWWLLIVVGGC